MKSGFLKKRKLFFAAMGLLIAVFFGLFKTENRGDVVFSKVSFAEKNTAKTVIDLGKAGGLKRLLDKNKISANISIKPKSAAGKYTFDIKGLNAIAAQKGKKRNWQILTAGDELRVSKRGGIRLALEIAVPKELAEKKSCQVGELGIYLDGKPYGTVAIEIINSRGK